MRRHVLLVALISTHAALAFSAADSAFVPGRVYFGRNNYIEYIAGNSPYVISAPHDGFLTPAEIPDRTGNVSTGHDTNVQLLIRAIAQAVLDREGRYPHIIICHLERVKLDANRDIPEATQGNPYAFQAWKEYHSFIDTSKQAIIRDFGKGFYIDLHAHGHDIQRLELGYNLSSISLALTDSALDRGSYELISSIRTMLPPSGLSFSQLVRGPRSLGSFFENRGFPAMPSEMQPNPGSAPYFSGGYNTERHGSANGGPISGVQIECNMTGVRDSDASRKRFAAAVAEVLEYYTGIHLYRKPVVTSTLVLNEVMFDVPPFPLGDANGDGLRSLRGDEFVEIVNAGTAEANISGYRILERDARTVFTFPENVILKPNEYAVVFGGVSAAGFGPSFPPSLKLFAAKWGQPDSGFYVSSSKTNLLGAGDNLILLNPQANDIMDEVYWGSAVPHSKKGKKLVPPFTLRGDSIAGAIAQSVTRTPDVTGLWALHKTANASGLPYSPGVPTSVATLVADLSPTPSSPGLAQNYPNPFNSSTTFEFRVSSFEFVQLRVFDLLGRELTTLVNETKGPGTYRVRWNAGALSSGVYLYQLRAGTFVDTKKLLLTK